LKRQFPLWLTTVLIAYGSLYPFHFVAPASFQASLSAFLNDRHLWTSRGDELGNFVLFMPLGAAAVISLPGNRTGWARLAALFAGCVALSLATQVLQIGFPPREAALADVVSNSLGALAGTVVTLFIRRTMRVHVPEVEKHAWVPLLILAAWMVGDLWPLVPSIDFSAWKASIKPLLVAPTLDWGSVLFHLVAAYVVAEVVACFVSAPNVNRAVLLLVACVLVGKVTVEGQRVQASFVLGSALGLLSMGAFRRIGRYRLPWLLALVFAVYTVRSLLPVELRDDPTAMSWIPFASLLNGSMDINALSLANSLYFFVGMSWLVRRMRGNAVSVAVLLALWVASIEFIQRWLVGHTADITAPLLVLIAGSIVQLAPVEPERPALRMPGRSGKTSSTSTGRYSI
jgi:VanZ family protein